MDPFSDPKSPELAAGTPQNRSGADSGNSGLGGDFREIVGTRPEAKNGKKVRKRGANVGQVLGFGGPAEAAGEVRRGNPSGYGGIPAAFRAEFRTTPAPRWGTAN